MGFHKKKWFSLTCSSFNGITLVNLRFHRYVLVDKRELYPNDPKKCLQFANWFVNQCNDDPNFLSKVLTYDEAVFSLNSDISTKNVVYMLNTEMGTPVIIM